jgi:hypothetical protein
LSEINLPTCWLVGVLGRKRADFARLLASSGHLNC